MHDTAMEIGCLFFALYGAPGQRILDLGARDVNGSLRTGAPAGATYVGVDLEPGPGVDVVLEDAYHLPFARSEFDLVVSSSCFEHDPMFWLTFLELVRVTKPGGYLYISAPSNGNYHCYPTDNWRFYPDAGLSLEAWTRRRRLKVRLVESFIAARRRDVWNDCVMVFCRGEEKADRPRIVDRLKGATNVRRAGAMGELANRAETTEDQRLIAALTEEIRVRERRIAELEAMLRAAGTLPG